MVKEKMIPLVDYKFCMACCVCISACPFSCLSAEKNDVDKYKKAYPLMVGPENCTGCGICESACPVDAISMVSR